MRQRCQGLGEAARTAGPLRGALAGHCVRIPELMRVSVELDRFVPFWRSLSSSCEVSMVLRSPSCIVSVI